MVLCDYDCFNCIYDDCIRPYNDISGEEKRRSQALDDEILGKKKIDRKEYMRKYQREYYHGIRRGYRKKVKRIGEETIVFESVRAAAKSVGGHSTPIIECCKGKRRTIYGFRWEYV